MGRLLLLVIPAVLAAGCSSSGTSAAPPASSTTTTVATASVEQVASIVAQHRAPILEDIENAKACPQATLAAINESAFRSLIPEPGVDKVMGPLIACDGALSGVTNLATDPGDLADELDALDPPAEVASLAAQTIEAARALADEASSDAACMPSTTDRFGTEERFANDDAVSDCLIGIDTLTGYANDLKAALDGWQAYL